MCVFTAIVKKDRRNRTFLIPYLILHALFSHNVS